MLNDTTSFNHFTGSDGYVAPAASRSATHWSARQAAFRLPSVDKRFAKLTEELELLNQASEKLALANQALMREVDRRCASPGEKRTLLAYIEQTHCISRTRACRLINLARSTCWYNGTGAKTNATKSAELFAKVPTPVLQRRLDAIFEQVNCGVLPRDPFTIELIEFSLNRLGLPEGARAARTNIKLAVEIYVAWVAKQEAASE